MVGNGHNKKVTSGLCKLSNEYEAGANCYGVQQSRAPLQAGATPHSIQCRYFFYIQIQLMNIAARKKSQPLSKQREE